MKKGMWKRLAATTMAGLMALSLAGCSGGGDKTSETTAAQAAQGTEKAEWIKQVDHATSINPYTNSKRTLKENADLIYAAFISRLKKMERYTNQMNY